MKKFKVTNALPTNFFWAIYKVSSMKCADTYYCWTRTEKGKKYYHFECLNAHILFKQKQIHLFREYRTALKKCEELNNKCTFDKYAEKYEVHLIMEVNVSDITKNETILVDVNLCYDEMDKSAGTYLRIPLASGVRHPIIPKYPPLWKIEENELYMYSYQQMDYVYITKPVNKRIMDDFSNLAHYFVTKGVDVSFYDTMLACVLIGMNKPVRENNELNPYVLFSNVISL